MANIRILSGAVDEIHIGGELRIILRGVVDLSDLRELQTDVYQREAQPLGAQSSILEAILGGQPLPDIELGMRGQRFVEEVPGVITLQDPVFIIDGFQRVSTAIYAASAHQAKPRIGATIHFDTTREWERMRFHKLNSSRLAMSPNVLIRNMVDDSPAVKLLLSISRDAAFALHNRIQWNQRMAKSEILSGRVFARSMGYLHTHISPGGGGSSTTEMVGSLDRLVNKVGIRQMRENVIKFYEIIDTCWGIRRVTYAEGARHLRGNFLFTVARVFSDHFDFWSGNKLQIGADLQKKLSTFPINTDPNVGNLAGSSGKAMDIIYMLIRDHLNSGKRTRRLKDRHHQVEVESVETDEDERAA